MSTCLAHGSAYEGYAACSSRPMRGQSYCRKHKNWDPILTSPVLPRCVEKDCKNPIILHPFACLRCALHSTPELRAIGESSKRTDEHIQYYLAEKIMVAEEYARLRREGIGPYHRELQVIEEAGPLFSDPLPPDAFPLGFLPRELIRYLLQYALDCFYGSAYTPEARAWMFYLSTMASAMTGRSLTLPPPVEEIRKWMQPQTSEGVMETYKGLRLPYKTKVTHYHIGAGFCQSNGFSVSVGTPRDRESVLEEDERDCVVSRTIQATGRGMLKIVIEGSQLLKGIVTPEELLRYFYEKFVRPMY